LSTRRQVSSIGLSLGATVLALFLTSCDSYTPGAANTDVPRRTDGTPIPLSPANLLGKSSPEVGQYVLNDILPALARTLSGTPQALLARPIQRDEAPALIHECIPDLAAIEDPPLMLVILKGDFEDHGPSLTMTRERVHYIAVVMDVWAGGPILEVMSKTGGPYREALQDYSLPDDGKDAVPVCPTRQPRTTHYGDIARGVGPSFTPPRPTVPYETPLPTRPPVTPVPIPTGDPPTIAAPSK